MRFLGNHDPNIHFALLTDLPDSREPAREDNPLITLCSDLIHELNEKYASQNMGRFFCFTGIGFTTRARNRGWDGNASAASCSTSTSFCADNTTVSR